MAEPDSNLDTVVYDRRQIHAPKGLDFYGDVYVNGELIVPGAPAALAASNAEAITGTAVDKWLNPLESSNTSVRSVPSLSAGGRNVYSKSPGVVLGSGTSDLVVFGGTTADPNTIGNGVTLPVIGGGYDNTIAAGIASTIAGGAHHTADAPAGHTFIGGGSTQEVHGAYSTAVAGFTNKAESDYSVCAGGRQNISGDAANRTTKMAQFIGAGTSNEAEGDHSVVVGGNNNTADAPHSVIVGGDNNTVNVAADFAIISGGQFNLASEDYSSIPGGNGARATMYGQNAHASGWFATNGDAQQSTLTARRTTANATPTEMFLNGDTATFRMVLPSDSSWVFQIMVVARRSDADDESAGYKFEGVIDRNAGAATTALVGSVTKTVIAEDVAAAAWDCNVDANTAQGALRIMVTGEAAKTIKWVARVELTQVIG